MSVNSVNYRFFTTTPYSPVAQCTQGDAVVKAWLLNVFLCSSSCSAENSLRLQELAKTCPKTENLSQALIRDLNSIKARCIGQEYDSTLNSDALSLLSGWETPSLSGVKSPEEFEGTEQDSSEERVGSALKRSCIRSVTPVQNNGTCSAHAIIVTPKKTTTLQSDVLTPNSVAVNLTPIAPKTGVNTPLVHSAMVNGSYSNLTNIFLSQTSSPFSLNSSLLNNNSLVGRYSVKSNFTTTDRSSAISSFLLANSNTKKET